MGKTAILFSGQGSQYEGMGEDITNSNSDAALIYEKFHQIVGMQTKEIILNAREEHLSKTRYAQLAIFLNSICLYKEVEKLGLNIAAFAGLSLGEYTALTAAGSMDINSAIALVDKRGQIMGEAAGGKGSMTAVIKSDENEVEKIIEEVKHNLKEMEIDGVISVCNINSPEQIVVGGDMKSLELFEEKCREKGIKRFIRLDVEGPFHTEILIEAAEKFQHELLRIPFQKPHYPVFSNYKGISYSRLKEPLEFAETLKKQMHSTVLFKKCIENLLDMGCDTFIEIGPGKALSGFVKKTDKNVRIYNIERISDIEKLRDEVGV